jgi:hypothetical protein
MFDWLLAKKWRWYAFWLGLLALALVVIGLKNGWR